MMKKIGRKSDFESLEHRTMLSASPLETEVQLLQRSASDGQWYLGGTRTFLPHHELPAANTSLGEPWEAVASGDFTANGITDVLGKLDGEWWLQVNDGTQLFGVPWGTSEHDADVLGTGDFNADGWLDVLSRDRATGDLLVAENSQDGFVTKRWGGWTTNVEWSNIAVRDFDHDGLLDVLASEPNGNWWLARNHGAGFHNYHWGRFQDFNWQNIVDGDFNGDHFGDVAARGEDNTWWIWYGSESGLAIPEYWGHWKMRETWKNVGVADLNSDGRDDLIGRTTDGRIWVGSATDTRFHTWTWGQGWIDSADWSNVELIDVDEDGNVDQIGRANDGTFWVAKNTGEAKLQSHFWGRTQGNPEFVDYVSDFEQVAASDVSGFFPGLEPSAGAQGLTPESVNQDARVSVSLNDQNKIVLSGDGVRLVGIELTSPSGSLIPSGIPGIPDTEVADPFAFLLANSSRQITYGSLNSGPALRGELTLSAGWDPTSDVRDLTVQYGDAAFATPVYAYVDESLREPVDELPSTTLAHAASNRSQYQEFIALRNDNGDSTAEVPPAELNVSPVVPDPVVPDPDVPDPDVPVTLDPVTLDPVVNQPTEPLQVSLNQAGQFVIQSTNLRTQFVRFRSASRSLVPVTSAAPFNQILVVVLASNNAISFETETVLDLGWALPNATDDLIVEYVDATGGSDWRPAFLFGERESESIAVASSVITDEPTEPIQIGLSADNQIELRGTGQYVGALDLISPTGGLIPSTSPAPFEFILKNTANQVTLARLGDYIKVNGHVTLGIGWDPNIDFSDLQAQYGGFSVGALKPDIEIA